MAETGASVAAKPVRRLTTQVGRKRGEAITAYLFMSPALVVSLSS